MTEVHAPHMTKRYPELDALRGIAALVVLCFHFTMLKEDAPGFFRYGITGVDLFFIISGFVILMTLEKTGNWKHFAINRFSRLFPAYWACMCITAGLMLFNGEIREVIFKLFAGNFLMLQHYLHIDDLDGPYWSLLIELLFYLLMFVLFIARQLKRVELFGLLFLVAGFVYHFTIKQFSASTFNAINYAVPLINHFPLFFAGMLFYRMKTGGQTLKHYLLIVLCFVMAVFLFEDGGKSKGSVSQTEYLFLLAVYFSLFTLYLNNFLAVIVNRATIFLGTISYSLYLIHQYAGTKFIIPRLQELTGWNYYVIAFCIALPLTILATSAITFLIERPAMKLIREKMIPRKTIAEKIKA